MEVVIPLSGVRDWATGSVPREQCRIVAVVLEHEVQGAAGRHGVYDGGELAQEARVRVVDDRVDGIESQPVEVILLEPVERVVDEELPHDAARSIVEIDAV